MKDLLFRRNGRFTRELLLRPGDFGLGLVPERLEPDSTTPMVCGYCSTGCSLTVHLKDGEAVNLTPTTEYPVNLGMACPKGWEALTPMEASDRAIAPLVRDDRGRMQQVSWERALETFVDRVRGVQRDHGPESVAFLSTGQIATEEMVYLGALAKMGMGIVHGDGNTRQCMATAATAYKQSFGYDAPPYTYADFEQSDVIVLIGSNLCVAHPIMWERICRNPHDPAIVVVDPRKTETAMVATHHYAARPKTDLVLLYAIANQLVATGSLDRDFIDAHTTGFDAFERHIEQFTPETAADITGLTVDQIRTFAATITAGERVSFWWTMGVNQSHEGTRVAQAIINLALITGNIGRPGTGANSITGQCNAMGSRLFSNTTNLFGGRSFESEADRARVADILRIDPARIPAVPSLAYDQIVEGILGGRIKALWVIATNSAHSWINQLDFREVLGRLDLLVVQDLYADTETAERADIFLPAAGWAEKDGTFINSERRIGRIRKVRRAPGEALSDFHIFRAIAHYWGCEDMFASWKTPADVFATMRELSAGTPCDITGIGDYAMLDAAGGIQWPYPAGSGEPATERRLFADGRFFHADGKARLVFDEPQQLPEAPGSKFPLLLMTGRGSSAQWHTQTRTRRSSILRTLAPTSAYAEISPVDARSRGIRPNDWVMVVSPRGKVRVRAYLTHTVRPGHVFIPMHYAVTNELTFPAFDPHSRQPAYKGCAVDVRRLEAWDD